MSIDPVAAFLHRRAIRRIKRRLGKGEVVQAASPGNHDGREGTLILTNGRTFWVPRKGRIEVRRRSAMHDVRGQGQSGIVDARQPSWQVQGAPAGAAREVAQASQITLSESDSERLTRIRRMHEQGLISESEYQWMRRDRS